MEPAPKEVENVGVDAHLGVQVPLDLPFVDSDRTQVTLGRFFDGKRPVILTLNYSNCPMLCSLQLNGFFEALGRMTWNLGENFQMVTVSIDRGSFRASPVDQAEVPEAVWTPRGRQRLARFDGRGEEHPPAR